MTKPTQHKALQGTATETDIARLESAVSLDKLFSDFAVTMTPWEAREFAEKAADAGIDQRKLADIIQRLNYAIPPMDFGPDHPQTGTPHHHYKIGRERNGRHLTLELFKGYFPEGFDFNDLLRSVDAIGKEEGATVSLSVGNNSYGVEMHWTYERD